MNIQEQTGEQLATILNGEWNKLVSAQTNIQVINAELERRSKVKETVEAPHVGI